MNEFDVIVIGGGPAGVTAALRARELGASVALLERDRMGGSCTNDGCVPTRVLAKAARLRREAEQGPDYGLTGPLPSMDFATAQAYPANGLPYSGEETANQAFGGLWRTGFCRCWAVSVHRSEHY